MSDTWVGSAGGHFEENELNDHFFAELDSEAGDHIVSTEGISRWFTLSELCALEMPYTAKFVIEHYLKIGRSTNDMYVGVADGERVNFTKLPES